MGVCLCALVLFLFGFSSPLIPIKSGRGSFRATAASSERIQFVRPFVHLRNARFRFHNFHVSYLRRHLAGFSRWATTQRRNDATTQRTARSHMHPLALLHTTYWTAQSFQRRLPVRRSMTTRKRRRARHTHNTRRAVAIATVAAHFRRNASGLAASVIAVVRSFYRLCLAISREKKKTNK